MVIGMLKELNENLNSMKNDIETIKKNRLEVRNTIDEMKDTLEEVNSGGDRSRGLNK